MKIPATTLLLGSLLLGGCSTAPAPDEAPPPPPMMEPLPADSCGAQAVGSMNGQILDETTRRWIEDRSRADEIRVIQPDEQVTMDHRPGRLDIRVDDKRRILSLACG
ncbi:I78 family peptidase inhibitor [Salinicola sp. JS01]|uniref:I78 family peptidase inhibitor n=1 Tax=Salinicola sp. JS01 TaxID=3050071 RepID=UPI00255BF7BC|nr:I78 family peptidase inhibitor [Salinicola sp. JS01]WIX33393.1 I78 family peptidase inhibitor [Salinicola sp. JS01]